MKVEIEIEIADVERLRSIVARRIGLELDDGKIDMLREVLERRLRATSTTIDNYLDSIDVDGLTGEIGALAQELTVPETYFFRNIQQFHALTRRVLPERIERAKQNGSRDLRLLSAGCASGEEAYSLSIALREMLDSSWQTTIIAVDVNAAVLDKARRRQYSNWSLRETPPDVQERWFTRRGSGVVVKDEIADPVVFEQHNLARDNSELWSPGRFDVIFCRNVLMYFSPAQASALVARIAQALAPDGYLFLGHAETLRNLSTDFHLCHTDETFYYRRKGADEPSSTSASIRNTTIRPAEIDIQSTSPLVIDADESWYDAIRHANERVRQLTESKLRTAPPSSRVETTGIPIPSWDLDLPLAMLHSERFTDALTLIDRLPASAGEDVDVLLLRATLLTHSGRLVEAEETCRRLLAIDELRSDAHHVLALCHEGTNDQAGAIAENQSAIYLDATFAMPHLHLALLSRRIGDFETARCELDRAATLLEQETSSRILLFGGGFGRDALIALARNELTSTKDRS